MATASHDLSGRSILCPVEKGPDLLVYAPLNIWLRGPATCHLGTGPADSSAWAGAQVRHFDAQLSRQALPWTHRRLKISRSDKHQTLSRPEFDLCEVKYSNWPEATASKHLTQERTGGSPNIRLGFWAWLHHSGGDLSMHAVAGSTRTQKPRPHAPSFPGRGMVVAPKALITDFASFWRKVLSGFRPKRRISAERVFTEMLVTMIHSCLRPQIRPVLSWHFARVNFCQ